MLGTETPTGRLLRRLRPGGVLAALGLALILLAVIAPEALTPRDPLAIAPSEAFSPPSWTHPFGTDESGRDLFARVVHGAAASAGIGLAATAIGIGAGLVLGFAGALGPRAIDTAIARVVEVLFALPTLVLALLLVAVIGPGTQASVIAIGVATAPGYARILRSRVRGVVRSDYVAYARHEGAGPLTVFVRHIAPNTLWPLVATATLGVGQAIVWVSALSFLGLGALPPSPEWGAMLNAGRVYISSAWWMTVLPGAAIVATATVLTVLGRRASGAGSEGR
ncbi:ABC transporter permease [Microbacterium marinilacus]|uniref:ABC transporter permease n=1 Tax=Microbacterium marinilacus TaxID=415209 RepID=UPI0031D845DB